MGFLIWTIISCENTISNYSLCQSFSSLIALTILSMTVINTTSGLVIWFFHIQTRVPSKSHTHCTNHDLVYLQFIKLGKLLRSTSFSPFLLMGSVVVCGHRWGRKNTDDFLPVLCCFSSCSAGVVLASTGLMASRRKRLCHCCSLGVASG